MAETHQHDWVAEKDGVGLLTGDYVCRSCGRLMDFNDFQDRLLNRMATGQTFGINCSPEPIEEIA